MKNKIRKRFSKLFSHDIGIDLGTANTLVYVHGKGIVINEPTVVAVNQKTGQVVEIGSGAKRMVGRTPAHISAIKPLVDGVISDFEVAEEMLAYFINKAQAGERKLFGPRVVIGVPSGTTNVEQRAVRDAARNAGAREVLVLEEPMAAAIGMRLPIHDAAGTMVIDIGGGTTDIALISLGGIVRAKNIKIAGNKLNHDIVNYIRDTFKILIGEQTAEEVKIQLGSVAPRNEEAEMNVRGRDLVTGLPREVVITDADVREAIAPSIAILVEALKEVLESAPPEVVSDVMRRGVYVAGGGALLQGMDTLLSEVLGIPVTIADEPLTCVARGAGVVIEEYDTFIDILLREEHDIPPTLE